MIDIHSHILPGLDDGPQSIGESLDMARMAVQEGISVLIATPHHRKGVFVNEAPDIREAVDRFNENLVEHGIPLDISYGQEIHHYPRIIDDFYNRKLLTLDGSPYALIEFPSSQIPKTVEETLHELALLRITPIIAHPERNKEIAERPDKLTELVAKGALSQVTSHSITGRFGTQIQSLAMKLCSMHLVHFIASDAHNVTDRPFHLQQAYETIRKTLGPEYVEYFQKNAQSILDGSAITKWQPVERKRGKMIAVRF